jgi:hypothetical protein
MMSDPEFPAQKGHDIPAWGIAPGLDVWRSLSPEGATHRINSGTTTRDYVTPLQGYNVVL